MDSTSLVTGDTIVHFDEILEVEAVTDTHVILRVPYGRRKIVVYLGYENYWKHCRKYATS